MSSYLAIGIAALLGRTPRGKIRRESFKLGANARPGLGGAYVALASDPSSVYYNPAALAQSPALNRSFSIPKPLAQSIKILSLTLLNELRRPLVLWHRPLPPGGGGVLLAGWNADSSQVKSEESHYDYLL
jgi:hypothetical protein